MIGLHKMIEKTCLLYKKEKCTLGKEGGGLAWVQKDKGEVIFILDLLHWTGEFSWSLVLPPGTKLSWASQSLQRAWRGWHFPGRQNAIKIIHRDTIGQSVAKGQ